MDASETRYLELLSRLFPSEAKASAEIINLSAVLSLPKGTEIFASDIHGEFEAFSHLLKNGSGSIRLKIDDTFGDELSLAEKRSLATLIYYPREKMDLVLPQVQDERAWFSTTILRLVEVCKQASGKYTRSKVRRALPPEFAYIIEELMTENNFAVKREAYFADIIDAVMRTGRARALVEALCLLIQRLAIDHLHIVGDIYDRGPYPHTILDTLANFHSVDIQWGNHDIVWMGASLGQRGCIAHVVRNCARYGNLSILEDAYGINILPLAGFAQRAYADDPCVAFGLKGNPQLTEREHVVNVKIQKAMAVIQFKVEGQLIDENPSFGLEDRKLLDKIDYERGTVLLDGVEYELTDKVFPTIDPANPYRLTPEEENVMQRLEQAFVGCEKLQRHMRFLLEAGSLYKIYNSNLLFHASVPLNPDGSLMEVDVFGEKLAGRALYDALEHYVREAFFGPDEAARTRGRDLLWWMWLSPGSPLFAKSKMATFELYLIADKAARKEVKNPFYTLLNDERVIAGIFEDFGMDPATSRIVCGHVPVKVKDGEDPVKCGGRVLTIDGGFSKAYQPTTGIAGYTLISNSYGFVLAAHEPLESTRAAVENELDIHSSRHVVERVEERTRVADTDTGAKLKAQIADLERLLEAYRRGLIPERG
ncbi:MULTISPECIES: fructose-1,6-bisphosphatase [unclassified Adlercreutzia]|uniref:fructose-1,6-bisphosphatase n=1 Tax=unclassified Adlercreutzia TaxID=2636013 RepID=UPI0013E9F135|nr:MULTISPECIES: fructose-1,6-bisphosphatase [unclassified Adlercreutzia]